MAYSAPAKDTLLLPRVSTDDVADRGPIDAKAPSKFTHAGGFSERTNFSYDCPCQFRGRGGLSTKVRAMAYFVCGILFGSFPFEVARINAPFAALAAIMGRLMLRSRRFPVRQDAHRARGIASFPLEDDSPVAARGLRKRPWQAVLALIGGVLVKPVQSGPAGRWLKNRVRAAMLLPSHVMLATETARSRIPVSVALAAIYRACFEPFSHIRSLHDRVWSEPVQRANAGRVRQMFLTKIEDEKGAFYGV